MATTEGTPSRGPTGARAATSAEPTTVPSAMRASTSAAEKAGTRLAPVTSVVATMLAPTKIRKRSSGDWVRASAGTGPRSAACIGLVAGGGPGGDGGAAALLDDLHTHARADAVRPRVEHGLGGLEVAHASRRLHAHVRADHAPHQGDVGGGGPARTEPRGGL